jgi:hypothetical protein
MWPRLYLYVLGFVVDVVEYDLVFCRRARMLMLDARQEF